MKKYQHFIDVWGEVLPTPRSTIGPLDVKFADRCIGIYAVQFSDRCLGPFAVIFADRRIGPAWCAIFMFNWLYNHV